MSPDKVGGSMLRFAAISVPTWLTPLLLSWRDADDLPLPGLAFGLIETTYQQTIRGDALQFQRTRHRTQSRGGQIPIIEALVRAV